MFKRPASPESRQPRLITARLKENKNDDQSQENLIESKAKKLKTELKVELIPLSENILKNLQEKRKLNLQKEAESSELRRSLRNCGKKPAYAAVLDDQESRDVKQLTEIVFKGEIKYVSEFHDCALICDNLLTEIENIKDNIVPIGFDLEWPFSFQTGSGKTALAQICLNEKICYLLHLYNLKTLPASFTALLSHSKVKLVGVCIKNDIRKLTRDFPEFPGQKVVDNNCLDCGPYANSVLNRSCRWSLERLTAYLLKKRISKDPAVRMSKWHIHPLNDKQKLYAATDAYVSLLLHLTIEKQEILNQARLEELEEAELLT